MCVCARALSRSVVSDSLQPHGLWTVQSMEFSRPEYWSGYPLPSPGDLPDPGLNPGSVRCFTICATREATRFLTKVESAMKSVFLNNDVS